MTSPVVNITIPTISVVHAYINIQRGFIGGHETGINDGEFVKWIQRTTGNAPPDAWCASQAAKAGVMLLGDQWPVPLSGSCKTIGDWAERKGILFEIPKAGAIHLLWHERHSLGPRFGHAAGVLEVLGPNRVHNSEGNTTPPKSSNDIAKSRDGNGSYEKTRDVDPRDRFIYWWLALPTNKTS
jgi:hypothetical protein